MNFTILKLKFRLKLLKWKQRFGLEKPFFVNGRNSYFGNQPSLRYFEEKR